MHTPTAEGLTRSALFFAQARRSFFAIECSSPALPGDSTVTSGVSLVAGGLRRALVGPALLLGVARPRLLALVGQDLWFS